VVSFSYWSIKPWFLTEEKLTVVLIIPSSWGSQLVVNATHIKLFSGAVAEEKENFCKGSLSLPIFLLCYFLLSLFILFLFASFYQKIQKIVPFIVVIFVYLF
jgi:hypothetical protein